MTGRDLLDEAERLDALGEPLYRAGKYREAIQLAQRSLALREQALGANDLLVAMSCNNLGVLHVGAGELAVAEPLFLRALHLRERLAGPDSALVATTLNNLAGVYRDRNEPARAMPLVSRALQILEHELACVRELTAITTDNLGVLHGRLGNYPEATELHRHAIELFGQGSGTPSADEAAAWNNLGAVQRAQGRYADAEASYRRALAINEGALGPAHVDVALCLNNLSAVCEQLGRPQEAELLLLRALGIRRDSLGPSHPDIAQSLNNLAELRHRLGLVADAESLYEQAIDMYETTGASSIDLATCIANLAILHCEREEPARALSRIVDALALAPGIVDRLLDVVQIRINAGRVYAACADPLRARAELQQVRELVTARLGPRHPAVADCLIELAGLEVAEGAYAPAERMLTHALEIRREAFGPDSPAAASPLSELARVHEELGAHARAEALAREALMLLEATLGHDHPELGTSLLLLSDALRGLGDHTGADAHARRALVISERAFGPIHVAVAAAVSRIALSYLARRAYDEATPLLVRALEIGERLFGPDHLVVAESLSNLAALHQARGDHAVAGDLLGRVLAIRIRALSSHHPHVANTQVALAALCHVRGAYAEAVAHSEHAAELREHQLCSELLALPEPGKRALLRELRGETQGLVSLHADGEPTSAAARALALTTILRRKGRILDSLLGSEAAARTCATPEGQRVQQALTAARVALGQHYWSRGPRTLPAPAELAALREQIEELERRAYADSDLAKAATPATIAMIQRELPADAALIEFFRYRRFDPRLPRPHWQEEHYLAYIVTRDGPIEWTHLAAAVELDARVDAALIAMRRGSDAGQAREALRRLDAVALAPVRALLPDGFHLILAPDGALNQVPFEALVDEEGCYAIERRLVSYISSGRDLLRIGATSPLQRSPATLVASPDYGSPSSTATLQFNRLSGAAGEAEDLQPYFAQTCLTGTNASKRALCELRGPAVLHIATHGFFARPIAEGVSSGERAPWPPTRCRLAREVVPAYSLPEGSGASAEDAEADALDRAGLALAGANIGAHGILTAREMAQLDLVGTQLVVLSACETGVGTVQAGEGVYGLRRALVLAGAAAHVVSLWQVSDAATRTLMRGYYAGLARGVGRAEALRSAQLRMLRNPASPEYSHPYYWAAFISSGDWSPLGADALSTP